jgi:hypothetical protein
MENTQEVEMNVSRAISVLIQGVEIAQKQGAYTLDDAELLAKAVKFFKTTAKAQPVAQPEAEAQPETPTTKTRSQKPKNDTSK